MNAYIWICPRSPHPDHIVGTPPPRYPHPLVHIYPGVTYSFTSITVDEICLFQAFTWLESSSLYSVVPGFFIRHYVFKVHPWCCMYQQSSHFNVLLYSIIWIHRIYLFPCWWIVGLFLVWAKMDKAALNILLHVFFYSFPPLLCVCVCACEHILSFLLGI